jgi:serine/threonine protein kinase HipA of HipAB toxin-antitoxin module
VSALYKYERPYGQSRDVADLRTGASYPRLFNLLRLSPTPARDRLNLPRWSLFQVLIGNTDAHAKNLSFYFGPQGLVLAPAYDLVSGVDGVKQHVRLNDNHLGRLDGDDCRRSLVHVVAPLKV